MTGRYPLIILLLLLLGPGCGPSLDRQVIRVVDGEPRPTRFVSPSAYKHLLYARIYLARGRWQQAAHQLQRALFFDPDSPYLHTLRAEALVRQRLVEEARQELERALELRPGYPDALLLRAKLHWSGGQALAAERDLRRCVAENPQFSPCHVGLAAHFDRLEQYGQARRVLEALVQGKPLDRGARRRLALSCYRLADFRCAAEQLTRALDQGWEADLALELARVQRGLGRLDEAVALLRRAFDRSGGAPAVALRLVAAMQQAGRPAEQVDDLLAVVAQNTPSRAAELKGLVELQLAAGRPAAAARTLTERGAPLEPSTRELLWLRVSLARNERDEAEKRLKRLFGSSLAAEAERLVAAWLVEQGEAQAALARLRGAANSHEALRLPLGRLLIQLGRAGEAVTLLAEPLRKRPTEESWVLLHALALQRAGQEQEALRRAEALLKRRPQSSAPRNFIAYSLVQRGEELDRAERLLHRALFLAPGAPYILDSLGWLAHRRGALPRAQRLLTIASRLAPRDPEILHHLAQVEVALKRPTAAMELLKRALANCHDTADTVRIRRLLRSLERERVGTR